MNGNTQKIYVQTLSNQSLKGGNKILVRLLKLLRGERGSIDIWVALTIAIILLLPIGYATSEVVQAARIEVVLQQGSKMVSQAETAAGGYTNNVQLALSNYLSQNGLNPDRVYVSTTPGQQGYGENNMDVVLGYDYDVVLPGTQWSVWHAYVQGGEPSIQSDYVPGAIAASIVTPGDFTGKDLNGSGGNTPITVVNSLTLSISPASAQAGQSITVSGTALEGTTPSPAGTMVSIDVSGAGINTTASTNSSGGYSASFTVQSAGTYTVTVSCGIATTPEQLTVIPASASQIQLTAPQSVTVGNSLEIDGQVLDKYDNPLNISVSVTSNDKTDITTTSVAANNGSFQLTVNQITMSPLSSPLTVTFSSGTATQTASITVLPGPPQNITLTASKTAITAGQTVTFSGAVTSVASTPVATSTSVGISNPLDTQDTFPVTVQTAQSGSYASGALAMTLTGTQAVNASVTQNGQTITASVNITVSPSTPAKVANLATNPNPVFQGASTTVTGKITDQYNNPIPGITVNLISSGYTASYTATTAADGSFSASVVFTASGTQSLSVQYNSQTLLPGGINVSVQNQGAYLITAEPATQNVIAGQTVSQEFLITNSVGSPVTNATVTISAAPASSTSLSITSGTTNSSGDITLQVTPDATGATSITATVAGCGGTAKLNVTAAAPFQITAIQVTPSFIQVNPASGSWPVASGQVLDQYGNPVVGASITVSGGYGAQASGTTNANGVFSVAVDPTNVGGPFYATVSASDSLGSINATSGTGLTVVQYPPATMTIALVNPSMSIYTGQLIPVFCTLYNQNMQLWNNATVEFVTVTDANAQLSNLTPSGPSGSGTGSLAQNTGTYANGESAANVNFDQSGSQTVLAELYINGNFTGACAALTMTVLPGAVSQIEWNAVSPGTTVTAGSTLTVSGFALNSLGKPVPNGTEVVVQMPGTSTQPRTVYTSNGTGYFTAQLTVTNLGSWNLQAVASGQTFTYGSPTPILVNAGAPASIVIWGETVGQTIPLGMASAGFGMSVLDEYGNPCPNIAPVLSMTASNGGRVPLPLSQPGPTGGFGQTGADEGPFDYAGNYTITATYGSVSTTDGFAVAANAPEVYSITGLQYHFGGNTYNFNSNTVNIPAGTTCNCNRHDLESVRRDYTGRDQY